MEEGNAREIIASYWQSLNIRLKLVWISFGCFSSLHVTSKILELICQSSYLHWIAVVFILSLFLGMWMGVFICFVEDFSTVNHRNSIQWTKPLALGIQSLYLPCEKSTHSDNKLNAGDNFSLLKDEIAAFVELIMQDFIHAWYDEYIRGNDVFPENIYVLMRDIVAEVLKRLRIVDHEVLLLHTMQAITKHLTILEKSRHNLKKLKNTSQNKSQHFLVACYETFSVLHPAATSIDSELDYLRSVLGAVFNCFLSKKVKICEPGVLLVREIICQAVLQRAIDLICEPEFINDLVVMLAEYVASSSVLETDQKMQSPNRDAVDVNSHKSQQGHKNDTHNVPESRDGLLQKDSNTIEVVVENCQNETCAIKQTYEYSSHPLQINELSCDEVVERLQKIQNTRDDNALNLVEKTYSDHERRASLPTVNSRVKTSPNFQVLVSSNEDSITEVDRTYDGVSLESSHLQTDIPDQQVGLNFSKDQNSSSLSCFLPVSLPKRSKSPALSNLSRSVDSIMDCEATCTPGELVTEPAQRKGHSRNSSYPSVIPSDLDFSGNQESTESLNNPSSQDTIQLSDSMPALRGNIDGKEEEENICISNLRITSTEQMQEYNSKKTYVLYVLEFQVHAPSDAVQEDAQSVELQVKRRYREFLTLHWKLDQRQELKKILKNVKNAPKRFALPIMKKDTAAIEQRRNTLERYLKQLLDIPAIHSSPEMVEFLALKGNGNIAFVQASTSYAPKFDKILRRSLSEVKQGLKNLAPFPSSKPDVNNSAVVPEEKIKSSNCGQVSEGGEDDQPVISDDPLRVCSVKETAGSESMMHVVPLVIEEALSGLDLMIDALPENTLDPVYGDSSQVSRQNKCNLSQSSKTEGTISGKQKDSAELPLFSSVMDIIGILQQNPGHWMFEENVNLMMTKLAGDFVQRFINREVSVLLAPKSWALYLSLIREALWPEGELYQSNDKVLSASEQMELFKKAENILLTSYPGILNILIGEDNMKDAISQLFESVQNKQLNKHLIYTFIDHLLEQALPEMKDVKFMDELMGQ